MGSAADPGRDFPTAADSSRRRSSGASAAGTAEATPVRTVLGVPGSRAARGRRSGLGGWRRGRRAQRPGGPQPCPPDDRLPKRAALRDARRSCGSTPPGWPRTILGRAGPPTRRTSRPTWTTSTNGAGPTRPTVLDDISEMLQEVRAAHAWAAHRGDLPLTARITAALGAYWFLEGNHAGGAALDRRDVGGGGRAGPLCLGTDPTWRQGSWRSRSTGRRHASTGSARPRCSAPWGRRGSWPTGSAVTSATYIGDAEQHESAMRTNDEALALGRGAGSPAWSPRYSTSAAS